jgi:hypothetical protein
MNLWDDSKHRSLKREHQELEARLPGHLILTPRHPDEYIYGKPKSPWNYVLIHALHYLITMFLCGEYIPSAARSMNMPVVPLDELRIAGTTTSDDCWIAQAGKCFAAFQGFAELLRAYDSAGALVDSIIVGWATTIVGQCGE